MFYAILGFIAFLVFMIVKTNSEYNDEQYEEIEELEQKVWKSELDKSKIRSLANEQNLGLENLKAGNNELAYENFQNVKDEIERLYNEKELDNADNENV